MDLGPRLLPCVVVPVFLVAVLLLHRVAPAGEGDPGREAPRIRAEALIEAVASGRWEEFEKAAVEIEPDPYAVAQSLFTATLDAADAARAERARRAVAAWAATAEPTPRGRGLLALGRRWEGLAPEDVERERRLVQTHAAVQQAVRAGQGAEVVRLAVEAESDVAAAPWSITAWGIVAEQAGALARLGRPREARLAYERAGDLADDLGWSLWAAIEWHRAADLAFEGGHFEACAALALRAAERLGRLGDVREATRMRTNAAFAYHQAGRFAEAEATARDAVLGLGDRQEPDARQRAWDTLALAQSARGDLAAARESLASAVAAARETGRGADLDRVLFRLGDTLLGDARWAEALEVFEELESRLARAKDPALSILVHRALATLERALGRPDRALPHAEATYRLARRAGDPDVLDDARSSLALTLSLLGRSDETAALFEEVSPGSRAEGEALLVASERERAEGRLDAAERAARHAIQAWEAAGVPSAADDPRLTLARILIARGRVEEARSVLRAVRGGASGQRSYAAFLAAAAGAEAHRAAGQPEAAMAAALDALRILRSLASGLAEEDAWGTRAEAVRVAETGLLGAADFAARSPADAPRAGEAAFALVEGSRGLLLAEGILNARSLLWRALPPDLVAAEESTRQALESARRRALRAMPRDPQAEEALTAAWNARDAALGRIERAARRATAFLAPPPPDLSALQASLAPGEAHLAYTVGPERVHAVLVRSHEVLLRNLGPTEEIRRRVEGWLRVAAAPDVSDVVAAAGVGRILLEPLAEGLRDVVRLTVVPDDFLAFAPFEALVVETEDGPLRLLERAEVVYAGSAGVTAALRAEAGGTTTGRDVLAVGDPAEGAEGTAWARLPGGAEEAEDLAARFPEPARRLLTGEKASAAGVLAALREPGRSWHVVHFACHGVVDPSRRRGTGLLLAGGEVLDADTLAQARIDASLAVLSACESGRGRVVAGEGVFGLVRSLHLAGVPRVIATQWVVSDRSTRRFMARFYEAHLGRGLSAAEALRDAKREALRAGGAEASTARWAPFVLWGLAR